MLDRSAVITACLRFYKASDCHQTAQKNLEQGDYDAANDRAYFCMFHAARALLAYDGLNFAMTDHAPTNVIFKTFHELYIKEKYHDPRLREMLETARKIRNDEIFSRSSISTKDETERNIQNAGYFLEALKTISNRRLALENDQADSVAATGKEPSSFPSDTTTPLTESR